MKLLRIYFNYILFTLGMREVLPRDLVNKVVPIECNEPLVVLSGKGVFTGEEVLVRVSVSSMLKAVAENPRLKTLGYGLFVYEGYRSNEKQRKQWNRVVEDLKKDKSKLGDSEIENLAQKQIARPDGQGSGHQTGGAVDITLCTLDGTPLPMGTGYPEFNEFTKTSARMKDEDVRERRRILLYAMRETGFVNYPNEWWHYSFGDRMWAAYLGKKICPYGIL